VGEYATKSSPPPLSAAASPGATTLELVGITAGYGQATILRDVSLTVRSGEVLALLGPNGAGKTTMLRVASGSLHLSSGQLLLDGQDATHWLPHELTKAGVCYVPEGRAVFASLSVRENLVLFSQKHAERDGIDKALDAFPALATHMRQTAGTLSGGEQQMLALARAYMQNPRYILLDEVSLGLAPIIVDAIFEFIALLVSENVGLLLVEQYANKALAIASKVCILSKGTVDFFGTTDELRRDDLFARYAGMLKN
jgi:branched-chain amino acid transport system ATP-binding protein